MNLANKLTLLRVVLVPVFIVLYMMGHYFYATYVFVIASCTDFLDGKIARDRGLVTNFGKIMDPLADKILVYSAFVLMVEDGQVPGWMFIVILTREFLVAGLRTVAAADGTVIAADMSGKIKTVLQMLAVGFLMVRNWPFSYIGVPVDQILLWGCVIMTVYSGAEYVIKNRQVFTKGGM